LIRNADAAMYLAKDQGRHTFRFYSEALTTAAQERLALEMQLRAAVSANELTLAYQPR
jgi:predicted signal transduction protein with EAL and GGDEF domain